GRMSVSSFSPPDRHALSRADLSPRGFSPMRCEPRCGLLWRSDQAPDRPAGTLATLRSTIPTLPRIRSTSGGADSRVPSNDARGETCQMPRSRDGILRRPRVEARLFEATGRRLTALTAGPGYGKTTLLTQVFPPGRAIWHTCTSVDTAVAQFARTLYEKTRLLVPALSPEILLAIEGA